MYSGLYPEETEVNGAGEVTCSSKWAIYGAWWHMWGVVMCVGRGDMWGVVLYVGCDGICGVWWYMWGVVVYVGCVDVCGV